MFMNRVSTARGGRSRCWFTVSSWPGHKHKENIKSYSLVVGTGDGTAAGRARVPSTHRTKAAHKEDVQSQRAGLQPSLEHTI